MRRRRVLVRAALALTLAAAGGGAGPAAAAPVEVPPALETMRALLGKPAPDFALTTPEGESLRLADLREGDPVIVVQFWASWCVPCHIEALIYTQMLHTFREGDLVVVGLHSDDYSVPMIPEIRERIGMRYPVAVATEAVWNTYGNTPVLPMSVVIGRSGRVRRVELGVKWVHEVEPLLRALTEETVEQAAAAAVSDADFEWGGPPEEAQASVRPSAAGGPAGF